MRLHHADELTRLLQERFGALFRFALLRGGVLIDTVAAHRLEAGAPPLQVRALGCAAAPATPAEERKQINPAQDLRHDMRWLGAGMVFEL